MSNCIGVGVGIKIGVEANFFDADTDPDETKVSPQSKIALFQDAIDVAPQDIAVAVGLESHCALVDSKKRTYPVLPEAAQCFL